MTENFILVGLIFGLVLAVLFGKQEYKIGYLEGRQSVYTEQLNMSADPINCYAKNGGCK